ncbi:hypothetical protein BDV33DRAFT_203298 [Aspergillus novoparasiticus]|uniref:Uncharacterized protein n=1 Tax=Aspergillus novoparasiticus TaxID=986946 RepID=A0A5N6ETK4_9EURO|nr:hypothetical protein BDV33DRAFT_203298 [Aspergillus novoparasiticus]
MGLTWRQSLAAIVVGNIIATGLLIINSLPGMFYHIGFPLVNRYVWDLYGSLFVLWNRIYRLSSGMRFKHGLVVNASTSFARNLA